MELDFTNPLAVIVGFFSLIVTFLVFVLKFALFGIFGLFFGTFLFGFILLNKR